MPNRSCQQKFADMKVLVVEDQTEIRAIVREVLKELGVTRILEAGDGRTALQMIDAECDSVNFVICDWNMPAMPGIDLLRQVRSVFPNMPFMMVTGRSDKQSVVEAKGAGVTAYIRKPFAPDQLEAKLLKLFCACNDKAGRHYVAAAAQS